MVATAEALGGEVAGGLLGDGPVGDRLDGDGVLGGPGAQRAGSDAGWLVEYRRRLDASEACWLEVLGRFDAEERWAAEGHLSCVDWLCARAGMSRPTAFDKVRVARQLRARPVLAGALAEGRVPYCAVRAMTRAEDTTVEVDEALVAVAEAGTVADVEAVVRSYRLYQSQERRPSEARRRVRGVRVRRLGEGMVRLEAILTEVEAAELEAVLRVLMERAGHVEHSPYGGPPPDPARGGADPAQTAEYSREESAAGGGAAGSGGAGGAGGGGGGGGGGGREYSREDSRPEGREHEAWFALRADALMDLVRCGLGEFASGADRHLVHFVVRDGRCSLLGGQAVPPEEMARVVCDCSHVTHVESPGGVPLALGRRQRVWSSGQRRAVIVRDDGRCRWPGCERTRVDIHHLVPWETGGHTDVGNGVALCPKHHGRLHGGYFTTGSVNATLTFHRPGGGEVGTSRVPRPVLDL
ncbi:HNH endonuclease [Acidiferrimicrobium sp. IK]|uniref:HNH endonuclease n=1 Tax=Acidiferrimicrobium sp. IK TaxID=2871700 RepID=UPI0021CAF98D|nr:HNH endonuclease signature motif containing protein [Acidiferrimicrobium sp. IK]